MVAEKYFWGQHYKGIMSIKHKSLLPSHLFHSSTYKLKACKMRLLKGLLEEEA